MLRNGKKSNKKLELFAFFLCVAVFIVVMAPFCSHLIPAGHVGVYFSRFFGGTIMNKTLAEGFHLKLPWDAIINYDARLQSRDYNISALTAGGLSVQVDMSVIWFVKKEKAALLHIAAGPEYLSRIINPSVISTVRSVIGSTPQSQLYDGNPLKLQDDVMELLNKTLEGDSRSDMPFKIDVILIRKVTLPEEVAAAISGKFVEEQNVLTQRYRVLGSVERYKKSFVDAEAVRITQNIVNAGMSEAYLRFRGIEATLELAKSENAKIVVIGDKDGMPLILNPGTMEKSASLTTNSAQGQHAVTESESMKELKGNYSSIIERLNAMDYEFDDLTNNFTQAQNMGDYKLPQLSEIPKFPKKTEKED